MDLWSLGRLEIDEGEGKSLVGEMERARSGRERATQKKVGQSATANQLDAMHKRYQRDQFPAAPITRFMTLVMVKDNRKRTVNK